MNTDKPLVSLTVDDRAWYRNAITGLKPKGQPRNEQRLIRIKRNLIRELNAYNKEIKRHLHDR